MRTVPLPALTRADVLRRANEYMAELQIFEQVRVSERVARIGLEQVCTLMLEWLWDTVAEPILTALGLDGPPADGAWPRIWWCPTGPLALLPVHAAGYHDPDDPLAHRSVLDRVISSYTPTVRALEYASTATPVPKQDRLLVVSLPVTPGMPDLWSVSREQTILAQLLPDQHTDLTDTKASHHAILEGLADHRWVHASCHGTQNLDEPSTGGLIPYDWQSAGLITIADIAGIDSAGGEFIFLCACKTATSGVRNVDEAITLAAGLNYLGWRHVLATLWSTWDGAAADISGLVYQHLVAGRQLDPSMSALALHQAIRHYRDIHAYQPSRWIPFIHLGP
ncbi:CHAT domain-containing protein [Nocardia sp. NPDC004604]|uniref:CHAT domain-containing protein n=1 Tax=Nocardia sp. NPDC004604 TaxID=3157013 RepID=UPI0033B43449